MRRHHRWGVCGPESCLHSAKADAVVWSDSRAWRSSQNGWGHRASSTVSGLPPRDVGAEGSRGGCRRLHAPTWCRHLFFNSQRKAFHLQGFLAFFFWVTSSYLQQRCTENTRFIVSPFSPLPLSYWLDWDYFQDKAFTLNVCCSVYLGELNL